MKEMELREFLFHLKNDKREDKRFCFILGAGASKQSGIKTGAELARIWLQGIKEMKSEEEFNDWVNNENIDTGNPAPYYSKIYDKRYLHDPKEGYDFLEKEMESINPSCGYSVLAKFLAETKHRIVITTNFDSLTEDSLFIYTSKKPLVVGHESLAGFINPLGSRPIVVKIHRDLLLAPKNDNVGTETLAESFKKSLKEIFKNNIPIVIGYGGNDGSLMNFLKEITVVDGSMFWFYRKTDGGLSEDIIRVIEKFDGYAVPIIGFDELMIEIGAQMGYGGFDKTILETAELRIKQYTEQVKKINKEKELNTDTRQALKEMVTKDEKSWFTYSISASLEKDPNIKEKILCGGLKMFPENGDLLNDYALFLRNVRKDYNKAEEFFIKALKSDPSSSDNNGTYATFLETIRKDYDAAEKYYIEAIKLDPTNDWVLGNYTTFLHDIRKNNDEVDKLFKTLFEIAPDDADHNGNYAKYLIDCSEFEKAKIYINRAFELMLDTENVELELELNFYCYAIFWKDYPTAKENIENLIAKGVTSPGWLLSGVIEAAKKLNNPDIAKLEEYAEKISRI